MEKEARPDYWALTQECEVIRGTAMSVTDRATIHIDQVLKGTGLPEVISFPIPATPAQEECELRFCAEPPLQFKPNERCILFLQTQIPGVFTLRAGVTGREASAITQSVKEYLTFSALPDDASRCKFLVRIITSKSLSSWYARVRLERLNRAEFLKWLEPLARLSEPLDKRYYWHLLQENPAPEATILLRKVCQSEAQGLLHDILDEYGRREPMNESISRALIPYLTHSDARVRRSAVFALYYRDFRPAFPEIVPRLSDSDATVRCFALAWPWYDHVRDHPDVLAHIKSMRKDPDPLVRDDARRALAGISPLYRFIYSVLRF